MQGELGYKLEFYNKWWGWQGTR